MTTMVYRRDVARDDQAGIESETAHIRAHLTSVANFDDDPDTGAENVRVQVVDHVDGNPALVSIIGELDAEPNAPYLRDGYQPDDDMTGLPSALDRDPVDLDAVAYAAHLYEKATR